MEEMERLQRHKSGNRVNLVDDHRLPLEWNKARDALRSRQGKTQRRAGLVCLRNDFSLWKILL